jgi:hypothetical protein
MVADFRYNVICCHPEAPDRAIKKEMWKWGNGDM